ncbi:hypothetical protein FD17_GL001248 [Lentilactobacillus sunkii DSM 19904]|uniref:5-methylcytosine-specific restriction enzyme subunit McrC n=2 Tax=Lentilactobacillus sunkii TaxID=481719 RepID=A0A0R1L7L0_9LACO|nr:hypothetical protein FD17_GL001248 [Lentilactobacillus sunkii DSM 19904]
MLAFVYDKLNYSGFKKLGTEDFEDGYDLLGKLFLHACKLQLIRGFPHDYREYTEETSYPHGQIQMTESITQGTLINKRVIVQDDSFSANIPQNQLIKMVLAGIARSKKFPHDQRLLAEKMWRNFWPVRDVRQTGYPRIKRYLHRMGMDGSLLVLLSEILIEGKIFATDDANYKAVDLEDQLMSRLYEKFLLKYYQQRFTGYNVRSAYITWDKVEKDTPELPVMHSDVRICGQNKTVILDAKYYQHSLQTHFDVEKFHSNNMYQIITYVMNESKTGDNEDVEGILLYAKSSIGGNPDGEINVLGHRFQVKTLDLNVKWSQLTEQLDRLIVF